MTGPRICEYSARERVLIVEVNWMGDVLFSTPAIRAVRKKYPGAYLCALVVGRCKEILLGNNYLDEVMVLDEGGRHKGILGKLRLVLELRKRKFTIAYLMRPSLTRTLCVFLAGARRRIGFNGKKGSFFLTERVALPKEEFHRADIYYYFVTKARIPEGERYYDFFILNDDKKYIEDFLAKYGVREDKNLVILHVGGNWNLKLWPKENFARLIDELMREYNVNIIISGSFKDYGIAQEIVAMAKHNVLNACGLTTLKQLGVLFKKSDLVISADSGPLHVAMAMGARGIALFGPTSPQITGPFGKGDFSVLRNNDIKCVIPCYNLGCKDNICMSSIKVEDVLSEIERRGWLKALK